VGIQYLKGGGKTWDNSILYYTVLIDLLSRNVRPSVSMTGHFRRREPRKLIRPTCQIYLIFQRNDGVGVRRRPNRLGQTIVSSPRNETQSSSSLTHPNWSFQGLVLP